MADAVAAATSSICPTPATALTTPAAVPADSAVQSVPAATTTPAGMDGASSPSTMAGSSAAPSAAATAAAPAAAASAMTPASASAAAPPTAAATPTRPATAAAAVVLRGEGKRWSPDERKALAKAYAVATLNGVSGTDQTKKELWLAVYRIFVKHCPSGLTSYALHGRWRNRSATTAMTEFLRSVGPCSQRFAHF